MIKRLGPDKYIGLIAIRMANIPLRSFEKKEKEEVKKEELAILDNKEFIKEWRHNVSKR